MTDIIIETGQKVLEFLEEKIQEWELDRSEEKIKHDRKMIEIKKAVEKIKSINCGSCNQ